MSLPSLLPKSHSLYQFMAMKCNERKKNGKHETAVGFHSFLNILIAVTGHLFGLR
jgi:hypothetical protein